MKNMKNCIACSEQIPTNAKVCSSCNHHQNSFLFWLSRYGIVASVAFSLASLIFSGIALWQSQRQEIPTARVSAQLVNFSEDSFSLLIQNYGSAPTTFQHLGLTVGIRHNDGEEGATVHYDLGNPEILGPDQFRLLEIRYDSASEGQSTSWWTSSPAPSSKLTEGFIYAGAALGSNLTCQVSVLFTFADQRWNMDEISNLTNGNCIPALIWYKDVLGD